MQSPGRPGRRRARGLQHGVVMGHRHVHPIAERALNALRSRWFVPVVAALGLVLRLVSIVVTADTPRFFDEGDYQRLARSLLEDGSFSLGAGPSAYRPPGQPVFIAAVQGLFGPSRLAVLVAQALVLTTLPFAVSRVTRLIGGRLEAGHVAALIASLHPAIAYASTTFYPVALTTSALTLGLWLTAEVAEGGGWLRAAAGGAMLGVAGAATTYFAPLAVLGAVLVARRKRWGPAILVATLGTAPAAAWSLRNAMVLDTPSLSTSAGFNLALGANDRAEPRSGNWITPDPIPGDVIGETARDAAFRGQGLAWIASHPHRYAGLAARRAALVADSLGRPRTGGKHGSRLARLVGWAMLPWVLFGFAGLVIRRHRPAAQLAALALGLVAISAALTIVKPRFRFPLDPLLAAFAVVAAQAAWRHRPWGARAGTPIAQVGGETDERRARCPPLQRLEKPL